MSLLWNLKYPYQNDEILNLDWVLDQINEFKKTLEEWSVIATELENALGDIAAMKGDISTLKSNVATLQNLTDSLSDELNSLNLITNKNTEDIEYLKTIFFNYEDEINTLRARLESELILIDQKLKAMGYSLSNDYNSKFAKVLRIINELIDRINAIDTSVLNPWHEELGRVTQDKNNKLTYNDLADECLTAEEYLRLGLSADEYKDNDIAAINYARFGKKLLHFNWVYMPVEGVRQEISNVLTSIVDNIFNTYTAEDYAALDLTADEYAALNYTAVDYLKVNYSGGGGGGDTRGFVKYDVMNSGLTRGQFEHLGVSNT